MSLFSKTPEPPKTEAPDFIEVGQIVNAHGIKGDVKVQPWDVTAEQLCSFKTFYIDGIPFRPTSKRVQKDMVLMKIVDVDDMNAALELKTKVLCIKRGETRLAKGELFDAEIVGMHVYQFFPKRFIGVVEEVLTYPAHKLYKVKGPEHTYLIPAVENIFIAGIDEQKREISVKMIEGLAIDED